MLEIQTQSQGLASSQASQAARPQAEETSYVVLAKGLQAVPCWGAFCG